VRRLRVALLGAGLMGRFHASTLATMPEAELVRVVDADRATAERVAGEAGSPFGVDPEQALSDPSVEAVAIASPAASHAELIHRSLAAGKAVFCEKPLALAAEDAVSLEAAVRRSGLPFQIGFQRRFDPGVERLAKMAAAGELGELEIFRSVTSDPTGPDIEGMRRAAGIFHDTLSHDMDMALLFFGPIRAVRAWGDACLDPRFAEIGKPDTTVITLRFESGRLGTIDNRLRTGYGYETYLEVGGSLAKGVVRDDLADSLTLYGPDGIVRGHVNWFLERYRDAYRAELIAFVRSVLAGTSPEPGVGLGLEVQLACLAAERSYREDRTVTIAEVRAKAAMPA
jgi:myo-inositol 2-dehydrogenase/D-chiro-inositol 1-dehydrogenase